MTPGRSQLVGPLPAGDYTLRETDAPDGVTVTISPNPVTVTDDGMGSAALVTVTNTFPNRAHDDDGATPTGLTTTSDLPRTGAASTTVLVVLGLALLIMGAAALGARSTIGTRRS